MDRTEDKRWSDGFRPYVEKAPLAALALGISSGFPYAMIGATLRNASPIRAIAQVVSGAQA